MNNDIEQYLAEYGPVFCLDIGSGTQDCLLALPHTHHNNWPRWVLPSPAKQVSAKIAKARQTTTNIWLYGATMGGGITAEVQANLDAGLCVSATEDAAKTLHDDLRRVEAMGVSLVETCPTSALPIHLTDFSPEFWQAHLLSCGLPLPRQTIAAAQDHGFSKSGNRRLRMQRWEHLLANAETPSAWIYAEVPPELTRLAALSRACGGFVCDTGTSALLAFCCEKDVLDRSFREGITLVNAGNAHVLAALLFRGKVCALYEQHTAYVDCDHLARDLKDFRLGWLPTERVQKEGGHGTVFGERPQEAGDFAATFMTGPSRDRYTGLGRCVNPCGSMMTAGCFGLLRGIVSKNLEKNPREMCDDGCL